jgi:hypothetical protein
VGVFRFSIEKDGKSVLVARIKEEETRVVRKADFLFLPLLTVRWVNLDCAIPPD